ncbi:hypothetical protein SLS53_002077 [Cytospora paraplurivora]|uniref:Carboxylesterase family protein n=1 Tax=Cytospora paraplurivora TaxID=2898453 RepID=A0AAN9UEQ6_9PEZI
MARSKSTRNTVHWDKNIVYPSVDENTAPDARDDSNEKSDDKGNNTNNNNHHSSTANGSDSLGARRPSAEFQFDFGDKKFRGHQRRTPLEPETFIAPDAPTESGDSTPTNNELYPHGLVKAARDLDPNENVFEKHRKRQFQWVLSLPASATSNCDQSLYSPLESTASPIHGQGNRRYFGCNLLAWTKPTGRENQPPGDPEDKYLLLATPIDLNPNCSDCDTPSIEFTVHHEQFRILQQDTQHLINSPVSTMSNSSQPEGVTPQSALSTQSAMWSTATNADASEDSDNTLTMDPRREMQPPLSTIEDSLEEIDHFEDEVEAIAAATRMTHITEPEGKRPRSQTENYISSPKTATRTTAASQSSPRAHGSTRSQPSTLIGPEDESEKMPGKEAPTRKVPRPASLLPPKPLQKASKPPTVSNFELPGERVARELKERKAARLSMQLDPKQLAEVSSPPPRTRSVRSSKPPTVPKFELPGETISRMKMERLAARLKAEEEEAIRRRQFKARPPPSSVVSSSATVRSTFTSRQRESQAGSGSLEQQQSSKSSPVSPTPKSGAAKRQSVTMTPSLARTVSAASASSSVSTAQRGRTSSIGSSHRSTRATSSSNGSVVSGANGKRGSVSIEELQQQRARGREILARESAFAQDQERERRERQQAVALARQKYAEQSRALAANRRTRQQSSSDVRGS